MDSDVEWQDPNFIDVIIVDGKPMKVILPDHVSAEVDRIAAFHGVPREEVLAKVLTLIQEELNATRA